MYGGKIATEYESQVGGRQRAGRRRSSPWLRLSLRYSDKEALAVEEHVGRCQERAMDPDENGGCVNDCLMLGTLDVQFVFPDLIG